MLCLNLTDGYPIIYCNVNLSFMNPCELEFSIKYVEISVTSNNIARHEWVNSCIDRIMIAVGAVLKLYSVCPHSLAYINYSLKCAAQNSGRCSLAFNN